MRFDHIQLLYLLSSITCLSALPTFTPHPNQALSISTHPTTHRTSLSSDHRVEIQTYGATQVDLKHHMHLSPDPSLAGIRSHNIIVDRPEHSQQPRIDTGAGKTVYLVPRRDQPGREPEMNTQVVVNNNAFHSRAEFGMRERAHGGGQWVDRVHVWEKEGEGANAAGPGGIKRTADGNDRAGKWQRTSY